MEDIFLTNTVLSAYRSIWVLGEDIWDVLIDLDPIFDEFRTLEPHIKLIHRAALTLLQIIHAPLDEFIRKGLRTSEEAWENPPVTSEEAMEEVDSILNAMEPCINLRNGRLQLDDDSIFDQIDDARESFQSLYGLPMVALNESTASPPNRVRGATDEQIARLPVHVATEQDTNQECSICLNSFVVGENISSLPCSHRFHKKCVEIWLRQCATCPMDRSIVFPT